MIRERALKIVLVIVGLLFLAGLYPLLRFQLEPCEQMLGAAYATLGLFLVLASRNPSADRSLIAFTAWSSLVTLPSWRCRHSGIRSHAQICCAPYFRLPSSV
jgi:hypothetical protein